MVGREGSAWANITVIALHLPCIQMRLIYNKQPARPILDGGNLLLFLSRLFRQYLKMGYWELLLEISNKLLDTCSSSQSRKFKEGRTKSPEARAKSFHSYAVSCKEKIRQQLVPLFDTSDIQKEFICGRKKSNHPNCFCGWCQVLVALLPPLCGNSRPQKRGRKEGMEEPCKSRNE